MIEILGIKNANKLVPTEDDQTPTDPVQENQNALMNKPVKAFIEQDHQAHISVHMAAMQDPMIMQLMQNNPMAPQIQAAAMAHINEHIAFQYRREIEQQLGVTLPTEEENKRMSPEVAAQVAQMAAQAAQRLLMNNQQQAAQQQASQQAQDPVIQMQQQELQLKQQEMQRKMQKDQADIQLKQQQLVVEQSRIDAQKQIAGLQAGIKAVHGKNELQNRMNLEGMKLGAQVTKDRLDREKPRDQPQKKERK
jgi:hypothetical protein